jgi:hypothetical protein
MVLELGDNVVLRNGMRGFVSYFDYENLRFPVTVEIHDFEGLVETTQQYRICGAYSYEADSDLDIVSASGKEIVYIVPESVIAQRPAGCCAPRSVSLVPDSSPRYWSDLDKARVRREVRQRKVFEVNNLIRS